MRPPITASETIVLVSRITPRATARAVAVVAAGVLLAPLTPAPVAGVAPAAGASTTDRVTVTCAGRPATIVGRRFQFRLSGTPGRDVIVTNGAQMIDARGGNDLVCVTGGRGARVRLGAGVDRMVGSADGEVVVDLGPRDRVQARGGSDEVTFAPELRSGRTTFAGRLDLGAGDDRVVPGLARAARGVAVVGGRGRDTLELGITEISGPVRVDNRSQVSAYRGRRALAWRGLEQFVVPFAEDRYRPSLTFRGTEASEAVLVQRDSVGVLDLRMGGGADTVEVRHPDDGSVIHGGGQAHDRLAFFLGDQLTMDLTSGRTSNVYSPAGPTDRASISGFDRFEIAAQNLDFTGGPASERVRVVACGVAMAGGPGDDRFDYDYLVDYDEGTETVPSCLGLDDGATLHGDDGDDVLVGGSTSDTLVGGAGTDHADGGGGKDGRDGSDTCEAETEVRCER